MPLGRVVLLGVDGPFTRAIAHALAAALPDVVPVLEARISRWELLRRRLRRLSVARVAGQVLFQAAVVPVLRYRARERVAWITCAAGLDLGPIGGPVHRIPSVNDASCRALLQELAPAVVVVNGTRIIAGETLRAVPAPFVNLHAGITPAYRGVHGVYWALADGRRDLAGVTLHYLDEGIDTGGVIARVSVAPNRADSFVTYPFLQFAAGLPLLVEVVQKLAQGDPVPCLPPLEVRSRLCTHPTVTEYLRWRWRRGVC